MLCWFLACLLAAPPEADSGFEVVRRRASASVVGDSPISESDLFEIVRRPKDEALAHAVRELGHADSAVRERASYLLWCCGVRGREALLKAPDSKDREASTRAVQLLKRWRNLEIPKVQDQRLRGVLLCRSGHYWHEGLSLLLQADDDATALALLEDLPAAERADSTDDFARVRQHAARKRIQAGRLDEAEVHLRNAVRTETNPERTCRLLAALLSARGGTPDDLSRPEFVQSVGGVARQKPVLAWLLKARGEFEPAAKLSAEIGDKRLQHALRIELADWAGLFAEATPAPIRYEPRPFEPDKPYMPPLKPARFGAEPSYLSLTTIRLALSSKVGREDQARSLSLNGLSAVVSERPENLDTVAGHLLLMSHSAGALEVARENRLGQFRLLAGQCRFREAFAAVGIGLPLSDPDVWLKKLWVDRAKGEWGSDVSHKSKEAALVASIVARLGEPEMAQRLLHAASKMAESSKGNAEALRAIAKEELKQGMEDRAWQHLGQAAQESVSMRNFSFSRQHPNAAGVWWETRRAAHPEESLADSARCVVKLVDPATAPGLAVSDAQAEIESLVKRARDLPESDRMRWLRAAAETASLHKLNDLAHSLWMSLGDLQPSDRTALAVADGFAAQQAWPDAAKWYDLVWQRTPAADQQANLVSHDDFDWYRDGRKRDQRRLLSLILRARVLSSSGDAAGAEHCRRLARIWPLSDSNLRLDVARELNHRGLHEAAMEQFAQARQFADDDDVLLDIFIQLAESQPDTASVEELRLWELAVLLTMRSGATLASDEGDFPFAGSQAVAQRLHQLRVQNLIAAGNIEQALEAAWSAEAASPHRVQRLIALVTLFEKASAKEAADKLFQQLWSRRQSILADFPNAAEFHDQLASLGAACHRELNASLTHARRAVALRPKHAPVLITQARVHLARREFDDARQRLAEARTLAPSHPELGVLQRQLEQGASSADNINHKK